MTSPAVSAPLEDAVYRKVTWRLLPFLMVCYVVAYLDRVNVGFAKLEMLQDLQFSETIYGLGAGMFFIGYFLFEVPSNVVLHRVGARLWIGRIMISWGLVSAAFVFVETPLTFYALRFLLGIAEAGFYPGIILYLTYWFPSDRRARVIALFMTAIPVSGIFGGPLSGWIMAAFHGTSGWAGWQWLFVIEAIPALVLGVAVMFYLDNGIRPARWLTEDEKRLLEQRLADDAAGIVEHPSVRAVLADRRIWLMSFIYFCAVMGQYGLTFWMPTLVQAAGVSGTFEIGLLTAIPYTVAVVAMLLFGRSADRRRERRWHAAIPLLLGAVGLCLTAQAGARTGLAVTCLSIAAAGLISSTPLFWGLPTAFLTGTAAAAGIAAINSIGNLAGFVSPYVVGWLRDVTHSPETGLYVVAAVQIVGAAAIFTVPRGR
ncbi:MAG: MFS transporter [Acidobacteria bacterium]|nr:MFS transporter [Acidobacteriota bacterium]